AIDVGLFGPEIILYVSISAIGVYVTPSYELGVANKIARLFLIVATALFGSIGFTVGFTLYVLYLVQLQSLKTAYLCLFIPFDAYGMLLILFCIPIPYSIKLPY